MRLAAFICIATLLASASSHRSALAEEGAIRAGIVGCDTSHVIAFTDLINNPRADGSLAKVEVTVAFPGGSADLPASHDRLPNFVAQLRKKGIAIVDSLDELVERCDAILLESVDGRVHLEQFRAIAKGKPVFVDKPAAASLADVMAIFQIADATQTPVFSTSSLRYVDAVRELVADKTYGDVVGCETVGPMPIEPHHPDLFWYGIHGVEALFAILGPSCESVTRIDAKPSSLAVGTWKDGRIGSFRGLKQGQSNYAFTVYGTRGIAHRVGSSGYEPTVRLICEFFATREPPVAPDETIEIFAFMEAADESKRRGGEPVSIGEIIERARSEVAGRIGGIK
jgi:predicted dehydrogenase